MRFIVVSVGLLYGFGFGFEEPIRITPSNHPVDLTPRPRHNLPADGYQFITGAKQYRADGSAGAIDTTTSSLPAITTTTKSAVSNHGACMLKYIPATCKPSEYCGTRKMCVQVSGDPCCAPADGECPTATQLDIRCVKGDPINWCNHHTDCARSAICCDTGCGYNICVEQFGSVGVAANAAAALASVAN